MQTNTVAKLTHHHLKEVMKDLRERHASVLARAERGSNALGYARWATPHLDQADQFLHAVNWAELIEDAKKEVAEARLLIESAERCLRPEDPPKGFRATLGDFWRRVRGWAFA